MFVKFTNYADGEEIMLSVTSFKHVVLQHIWEEGERLIGQPANRTTAGTKITFFNNEGHICVKESMEEVADKLFPKLEVAQQIDLTEQEIMNFIYGVYPELKDGV